MEDNVQWINKNINAIKQNFSEPDLFCMIKSVYEHRDLGDVDCSTFEIVEVKREMRESKKNNEN